MRNILTITVTHSRICIIYSVGLIIRGKLNKRIFILFFTIKLNGCDISYIARRKYAEEVYEIQQANNVTPINPPTGSNVSNTLESDLGQMSTLGPTAASNIPLQSR